MNVNSISGVMFTHEYEFQQTVETVTPYEILSIARYIEGLPPPILANRSGDRLYEIIWKNNRYDFLLQLWNRHELPAYYFCQWPKQTKVAVLQALASDEQKKYPNLCLTSLCQDDDFAKAAYEACQQSGQVELLLKVSRRVFPHLTTKCEDQQNHHLGDLRG